MAGEEGNGEKPVLVLVPFEVQGHLNPLMQVANRLSNKGFSIIFLITDHDYNKMVTANTANTANTDHADTNITFMTVPESFPPGDVPARNSLESICHLTEKVIIPFAESLIPQLIAKHNGKVGMVIDTLSSSAIRIAVEHRVPYALFWITTVANFYFLYSSPELVSANAIHPDGCLKENKVVDLGIPDMPLISSSKLPWIATFKEEQQRIFYAITSPNIDLIRDNTKWLLCNSVDGLERPVCDYLGSKGVQPCNVGPLQVEGGDLSLREKDTTCMEWLDKQPEESVIYVAYGSVATMSSQQLEELARGLETCGMKFLWVLRDDLVEKNEEKQTVLTNMKERFGDTGCVVSWCPQMDVLCHPSVGCFLSHCGWNSTLDCIAAGKPMLCWPSGGDQFINATFITDVWRIGVSLVKDSEELNPMVKASDVKNAINTVKSEEMGREFKMNATKLSKCAMEALDEKDGSSVKNFESFVSSIKASIEHFSKSM